jgi:hypothetical protein
MTHNHENLKHSFANGGKRKLRAVSPHLPDTKRFRNGGFPSLSLSLS